MEKSNLPVQDKLQIFFSRYPLHNFKKGETILRPSDNPQGILYINTGYVRMYQVFEDGKELTLNIFRPGSYFSMIWAVSNATNTFYFQAMTATTVNRAPREDVIDMLKKHPDMLFELTNRMVSGMYGILSNIEHLLSTNACKRIASILVILADRFGETTQKRRVLITLSLSHEDIARLVNLTRETTSIEMKKLMDKKLVFYKRRLIIINDIDTLRSLSFVQCEMP